MWIVDLYSFKDYLTIDEALVILSEKVGQQLCFNTLQDLEREGKIKPLIYVTVNFSETWCSDVYHYITGYFTSVDFILLDCHEYLYGLDEFVLYFGGLDRRFRIEKGITRYTNNVDNEDTGYIHSLTKKSDLNPSYYEEIEWVELDCIRIKRIEIERLVNNVTPDNTELLQQVANQQATIDRLTDELANANAKIAELVAGKDNQSDTPAEPMGDNPLSIIMDTKKATYAPDLVHAINLWFDLYNNDNQSTDSHTNRANTWLKKNTGYENVKRGDKSMDRIREIATPLQSFGGQRAKEPEK